VQEGSDALQRETFISETFAVYGDVHLFFLMMPGEFSSMLHQVCVVVTVFLRAHNGERERKIFTLSPGMDADSSKLHRRCTAGGTESQNCRGWKDLWGSPAPAPLLKQVPCSRSHSKAFRWVLNICREGDSTVSPMAKQGAVLSDLVF